MAVVFSIAAKAQDLNPQYDAYWVIETNPAHKKETVVKIYNGNHQLMRQDTLKGKVLRAEKKRHQKLLAQMVKREVAQYELTLSKK